MISRARLKANRENARRSTGPKTFDGKRRSSQNAMKHGFRSKRFRSGVDDVDAQSLLQDAMAQGSEPISISAFKVIIETQRALHSLSSAFDQKLACLHQESDVPIDHATLTKDLSRISLYARRMRSLQKKAISQYDATHRP